MTKRIQSLDIFRGLTIAFMILVNNPGDWSTVYAPLLHADWHGCTPTDLVFPFFLFIVGVAISLALGNRAAKGLTNSDIYKKIIRRTFLIFLIGLFLSAFPYFNFEKLRIPGVLQRIAMVYGICAFIFLKTDWKKQVWIGIALLLLYWILMTLIPVPGHGVPNLEPESNLGAWLDNLLLHGHLWSQTKVWDPEGLLSTMPAVVTGIIGMLTGTWIKKEGSDYSKLTGLFGMGFILIGIGLTWDLAFPINKKIWTSSYVLYTAGIGLQLLALIYWLVDVLGYKKWIKPFVVFGMNSLFIYALSSLFAKIMYSVKWEVAEGNTQSLQGWLYDNVFTAIFSPYNASFAYAIFNVLLLLGVAWILYRKKIFIKV